MCGQFFFVLIRLRLLKKGHRTESEPKFTLPLEGGRGEGDFNLAVFIYSRLT